VGNMKLYENPSTGCPDADGKVRCSPIQRPSLFKSLERKPRNIQQGSLLYCAVLPRELSSVLCLAVPYFSNLYNKRHDFCDESY
jgi:hypothetical protein